MSQSTRFTPEQHFQLLLTHAREHQPVLGEGLEAEPSLKAPTPPSLPGRIEVPTWERPGAAPNDLAARRWGVIAPEGPVGDSLLRPSRRCWSTANGSRAEASTRRCLDSACRRT